MTAESYTVGTAAGSLTIGPVGTPKDFSCQVTDCRAVPDSKSDDDVKVLCGDSVPGALTETWTLKGTMFQDILDTDSLTLWLKANSGTQQPFVFEPVVGTGLVKISGTLVVVSIEIGGEAGTKPTSDFEFPIVGVPDTSTFQA